MPADREKEIFFAALDLSPPERERFLEERCASDAPMRARIEALLLAHEQAEEFMGAPTLEPRDAAHHASRSRPEPEIGESIGPYELESVLGEGGFGRVYLARQREPVSRQVALKVLKAGMDSRAIVARFETERQALAVMDHPSVARVFDGGQTPAGLPYFVMEHVRGEPITTYCERKGLSIRQRLALFEQVCLAVQHAHHKGIIHRDLKPSNVLVTTVNDSPSPKVIDFGIAKAVGAASAGLSMVTLDGQMVGTPAYMSPEQICGTAVMDTRSDVYTLGVLLYELLTGTLPFESARLQRTPLASLAHIICQETPPRPSTRVLQGPTRAGEGPPTRHLAGRLRGDLDWIIMKALEKEPGRRYQTAFAMASDIRRFLRDEPVEAGPPSGLYRLKKFSRRHRGELLAAGLVLAALVAGLVSSLIFAARVENQSRLTAQELERSNDLVAFTTGMLAGVDPAVARGKDTELLERIIADAMKGLDESPPDSPQVELEMRKLLGTALFKIADFTGAEPQFARALELALGTLGPDHPTTLEIRASLGQVYVESSRLEEGRLELAGVLDAMERTLGPDDPRTITALFNLAVVDRLQGSYERARTRFERVVELRRAVLGDRHRDTMSARNSLAAVADELGDRELAAALFREVIEFQVAELGEDHPHTLATRNNLADTLGNMGRHQEAAAIHEQVLASKRRVLPPDHPSIAISLNNLSHAYRELGKLAEAEPLLDEAEGICRRSLGDRDMRTLVLINSISGLLIETGRAEQAIERLTIALPVCEEVLGTEHPLALSMLAHLARAHLILGESAPAAAVSEDLVARADGVLPEADPARAEYRRLRGEALLRAGNPAGAEVVLLEAHELLAASGAAADVSARIAELIAEACDAQERAADAHAWRSLAATADR